MQRLLAWQSGDEERLESQRSGVQIQVSANNEKKNWGVRSRDRVRDSGVNREGGLIGKGGLIGIGGGVNRDRVRAGDEHIIPFEKLSPPPPPRKKKK